MTTGRAQAKPRGRTPSLISSQAGSCRVLVAPGDRQCKRCRGPIRAGSRCAEVSVPGRMGHRTFCLGCFEGMLTRTEEHVAELRGQIHSAN